MVEIDILKNDLVDSCTLLNSRDDPILNDVQLDKCREALLGNSNNKDEVELKIFGEDRDTKIKEYYSYLKLLLDDIVKPNSQISGEISDYIESDSNINMNNVVSINKQLDAALIYKHKNKESSQYNTLLDYYTKIDNNRNKDKDKQLSINTLSEVERIELNKLVNSSYNVRLIILINFIIIFVIILIIYIKF